MHSMHLHLHLSNLNIQIPAKKFFWDIYPANIKHTLNYTTRSYYLVICKLHLSHFLDICIFCSSFVSSFSISVSSIFHISIIYLVHPAPCRVFILLSLISIFCFMQSVYCASMHLSLPFLSFFSISVSYSWFTLLHAEGLLHICIISFIAFTLIMEPGLLLEPHCRVRYTTYALGGCDDIIWCFLLFIVILPSSISPIRKHFFFFLSGCARDDNSRTQTRASQSALSLVYIPLISNPPIFFHTPNANYIE